MFYSLTSKINFYILGWKTAKKKKWKHKPKLAANVWSTMSRYTIPFEPEEISIKKSHIFYGSQGVMFCCL